MSRTIDSNTEKSDPIRVCHVVNAFGESTGPANHAVALEKHTDVQVSLLGWFKGGTFSDMGRIQTYNLEAPDTVLGVDRQTLRRANEILSAQDVIHTHHPHSATFAKIIGRAHGIPTVFTYGTDPSRYSSKGRLSNALTNYFASRVTCVSSSVRNGLATWERKLVGGESCISVVHTGVDLELIDSPVENWSVRDSADIPTHAPLVGHAGRLIEAKGQDTLIRGIAEASELLERTVHLVIAGEGQRQHKLKRLVTDAGLEDAVTFLGAIPRDRTYQMMAEVDVFAMPSKWEGFSSAAIEAMALGTACVLSDIPAFREPFEDVAELHQVDDHAALGSIIANLLENDDERERLEIAAKQLVREEYTMEATAKAYAEIYRHVLGANLDQSQVSEIP